MGCLEARYLTFRPGGLKNNFTNPHPLTLRYAFSVFTNLYFLFLIVNKALNLIGGCVPCVAWGRNPRFRPCAKTNRVQDVSHVLESRPGLNPTNLTNLTTPRHRPNVYMCGYPWSVPVDVCRVQSFWGPSPSPVPPRHSSTFSQRSAHLTCMQVLGLHLLVGL